MNGLQLTTAQLKYLVAASTHSTLKEAAAELGVSPAALTQGIQEVERRMQIPLFERDGKSLRPIQSALPVFDYASEMVRRTAQIETWLDGFQGAEFGKVRVGMIDSAATHYYPRQVKAFLSKHQAIDFSLTVNPSSQLLDLLIAGKIDAAVVVKPAADHEGLKVENLIQEDIFIYSPPNTLDKAEWGPWVSFPKSSHTRRIISKELAKQEIGFEPVAESHQPEVLAEMVNLGLGWAALPESASGVDKLQRVSNKPLCSRQLVLATIADAPYNPALAAFTEMIRSGEPKSTKA